MLFSLLWSVLSGALIGWIAGMFMNESGGFWKNAIVGIIGSALGGAICNLVGIYSYGFIFGLIANVAGACLFIWLMRKFFN